MGYPSLHPGLPVSLILRTRSQPEGGLYSRSSANTHMTSAPSVCCSLTVWRCQTGRQKAGKRPLEARFTRSDRTRHSKKKLMKFKPLLIAPARRAASEPAAARGAQTGLAAASCADVEGQNMSQWTLALPVGALGRAIVQEQLLVEPWLPPPLPTVTARQPLRPPSNSLRRRPAEARELLSLASWVGDPQATRRVVVCVCARGVRVRACHCVCVCVCALCPSLGRTPRRCPPLPRALPPFSRRPPFSYIRVSPALTSESHIRVSPSLWAKLLFARAQGSPSRRDPWPPPGLPAGAARVPRRAPAPPIWRAGRARARPQAAGRVRTASPPGLPGGGMLLATHRHLLHGGGV